MTNRKMMIRVALACATALGGTMVLAVPAVAQTTIARVSGHIAGADGAPAAGATVTARDVGSNQTFRTLTDAGGNYTLNGLRPGTFEVTATTGAGASETRRVSVAVGQAASLDITVGASKAVEEAEANVIVVTGGRLRETRTSEIATNITAEQIHRLPQTDRNFLSFAQLAPGVNYVDSETNKGIQSGASTRSQVNVFIDGVSLKNQVLDGGIAGQQDSRGNPFPQLGVQEFRVLTQNYKAEYEQAGAAIITAITKSGTNEFHGEAFGQYTDKGLSSTDYFVRKRGDPKPAFKRIQYGAALGGPIVKDRLFFFFTYERNEQDRAKNVVLGSRTPGLLAAFGKYEGAFVSPFHENQYFGKLTFTPNDAQRFDLSYDRREETDIQGFGGQTALTAAENKNNTIDTINFKWTYTGGRVLNEFQTSYLDYLYNPTSLTPSDSSLEYRGVITVGGKDSSQRIKQRSYVIRDDMTLTAFDHHSVKFGGKFAIQDYDFSKLFFVQPKYTFVNDPTQKLDFSFPAEVRLGLGDPQIKATNTQYGLYAQDDWDVMRRLQLNIGVRWDYETNLFNNEYRTPAAAVATLNALPATSYFNPKNYITDGSNRPAFAEAIQPRVGFSYDLHGDKRTVFFGGAGRYYDRNVFNNTLDERFRLQYQTGLFYFSRDGLPRQGNPTLIWNPAYASRDALIALRAAAQTGLPELFAVKNNAKPPVNDQFSLGVRQRIGIFRASLSGSYIRGRNGYTHLFATRKPDGSCCDTTIPRAHGYGNVLIGTDSLNTRYRALYFTLDKDYTPRSGWGLNVAYTFAKGEQDGNDLFSLDKITPRDYGWRPRTGDQRHKIVLSGTVDIPFGFRFSTLTTLGSSQAFQVTDNSRGDNVNDRRFSAVYPRDNCIAGVFGFCEVNVSLDKTVRLFKDRHELTVGVDLFNAFNSLNFTDYNGGINPVGGNPNADFGTPSNTLTLPRRVQFRVGYRF